MRDVASDPRMGDILRFPARNYWLKVVLVGDDVLYLHYLGDQTEGTLRKCDRNRWCASIGEALVLDQVTPEMIGEDDDGS